MNAQISRLSRIAAAPSRIIAGLMSGTSLDGLDIALCEFRGAGLETQIRVIHFTTVPYPEEFKEQLKAIAFKQQVSLQLLTLMHASIGSYHAKLINNTLEEWNYPAASVDLLASHGQTIFHAPRSQHQLSGFPNATLQIGDGDHLAVQTGIITLSDFRQKHIAAGGEGAPLAAYGDYLLFSHATENRILLNIGGIANFTCIPAGRKSTKVFSTDTGPGNTLMDQYIHQHFPGKYYDEDAAIAQSGVVSPALVDALMDHPFFTKSLPKTTGPELFNLHYLDQALQSSGQQQLSAADVMASLCEFTARSITRALLQTIGTAPYQIYLSGGGMHNPLLSAQLSKQLGITLLDTRVLSVDPDAKEAVLFALLANECVAGETAESRADSNFPAVKMGKISLPG